MLARVIACSSVLSLAALVTFGGCDAEVDYSDPEEAGEAVGEAYCGFLVGCCGEDTLLGTETDCIELYSANFDFLIKEAEQDGYEYDPRCAEQLVRLVGQASCDEPNLGFGVGQQCEAVCSGLAHGNKQKGEACEDPRDCDFGLVCAGTCADPCGSSVGEPCGQVSDESYAYCESDLYCDLDIDTGVGTCRALPGLGEDCSTNYVCDDGLTCLDGTCSQPLANGEPCPQYTGCASNFCDTADPQNPVCSAPPGIGEPCFSICTADAYCDGTTCIELPGEGEPCPSFQCKPNLYCGGEQTCESTDVTSGIDFCSALSDD